MKWKLLSALLAAAMFVIPLPVVTTSAAADNPAATEKLTQKAKPAAEVAELPFLIYPSYGRDRYPENATPPWTPRAVENLVWIAGAKTLDVSKWELRNCLMSSAVRVPDSNGNVIGIHVRLYPFNPAISQNIALIQKDETGKVLSTFRMIYDTSPIPLKK